MERAPWVVALLPSVLRSGLRVRFAKERLILSDRKGRQIWLSRANAVYLPDIAESFDYYFTAVEPFVLPASAGGWRVVDYSSPRYHQVLGFPDFPVLFPSLAEPFQTCEQYLDFAQLREGQTVMDLGCYAGLTAISFSKRVGDRGTVIAAEPDPRNLAIASKNLALHHRVNGLDNVKLLPNAISSQEGTTAFSSEGSMGSASVRIVGGYRGAIVEVPTLTLDGVLSRAGAQTVDFIKMDIEGSELEVIRSSRSFFTSHRPRMIIEPHQVDGRLVTQELVGLLSSFGYRCRSIEQFGVSLPLVTAVPEERPGCASA